MEPRSYSTPMVTKNKVELVWQPVGPQMIATWTWTASVSHGWPAKGVGTGAGDSRPGPIGRECHSESMSPRIAQTSRPTTTQRRSTVTLQLTYPCPHVVTYRKIPIHTLFIPYPYLIHTLSIPYSPYLIPIYIGKIHFLIVMVAPPAFSKS